MFLDFGFGLGFYESLDVDEHYGYKEERDEGEAAGGDCALNLDAEPLASSERFGYRHHHLAAIERRNGEEVKDADADAQ